MNVIMGIKNLITHFFWTDLKFEIVYRLENCSEGFRKYDIASFWIGLLGEKMTK